MLTACKGHTVADNCGNNTVSHCHHHLSHHGAKTRARVVEQELGWSVGQGQGQVSGTKIAHSCDDDGDDNIMLMLSLSHHGEKVRPGRGRG